MLPDQLLVLRPHSIERDADERSLRRDVVADDEQFESPGGGLERVRFVRRPGSADLHEDRAPFRREANEIEGRKVDDPVGMRKDVDEIGLAPDLVRRLKEPPVQFRPGPDPARGLSVPAVDLEDAHRDVPRGRPTAVDDAEAYES